MHCRRFLSYVHKLAQRSPKFEEDNIMIYYFIFQQLENRHGVDQKIPVWFLKIVLDKLGNTKTLEVRETSTRGNIPKSRSYNADFKVMVELWVLTNSLIVSQEEI